MRHSIPPHLFSQGGDTLPIEIGILDKQCLNRRIATEADLVAETQAWQTRRNQQRKTIDWLFTRKNADKKLKSYYVA